VVVAELLAIKELKFIGTEQGRQISDRMPK
jgi:hypothetical protein